MDSAARRGAPDPKGLTVITVVKNNLAGLKKTYESLSGQSNQGFHWLVLDGLSTDGSQEWLASIRRERFRYFSGKDKSLFEAMNKAMGMLDTEYCMFLNGGDYFWDGEVADKILRAIAEKPFGFAYGQYVIGGVPGFPTRVRGERIGRTWEIFYGRVPCHQSSIISRTALEEIGGYREDIGIYGDREWILRYAKKRSPSTFVYLPFIIVYYDPNGLSYHRFFKYAGRYLWMHWINGNLVEAALGAAGWCKTAIYIALSGLKGRSAKAVPGKAG